MGGEQCCQCQAGRLRAWEACDDEEATAGWAACGWCVCRRPSRVCGSPAAVACVARPPPPPACGSTAFWKVCPPSAPPSSWPAHRDRRRRGRGAPAARFGAHTCALLWDPCCSTPTQACRLFPCTAAVPQPPAAHSQELNCPACRSEQRSGVQDTGQGSCTVHEGPKQGMWRGGNCTAEALKRVSGVLARAPAVPEVLQQYPPPHISVQGRWRGREHAPRSCSRLPGRLRLGGGPCRPVIDRGRIWRTASSAGHLGNRWLAAGAPAAGKSSTMAESQAPLAMYDGINGTQKNKVYVAVRFRPLRCGPPPPLQQATASGQAAWSCASLPAVADRLQGSLRLQHRQ